MLVSPRCSAACNSKRQVDDETKTFPKTNQANDINYEIRVK